jgi:hypothetical protein
MDLHLPQASLEQWNTWKQKFKVIDPKFDPLFAILHRLIPRYFTDTWVSGRIAQGKQNRKIHVVHAKVQEPANKRSRVESTAPYIYQKKHYCDHAKVGNMHVADLTDTTTMEQALGYVHEKIKVTQQYLQILQQDVVRIEKDIHDANSSKTTDNALFATLKQLEKINIAVFEDDFNAAWYNLQEGDILLLLPGAHEYDGNVDDECRDTHIIGLGGDRSQTVINVRNKRIYCTDSLHICNVTINHIPKSGKPHKWVLFCADLLEMIDCSVNGAGIFCETLAIIRNTYVSNCICAGIKCVDYGELIIIDNCTISNCSYGHDDKSKIIRGSRMAVENLADSEVFGKKSDSVSTVVISNTKFVNNVGMDVGVFTEDVINDLDGALVFNLEETHYGHDDDEDESIPKASRVKSMLHSIHFYGDITLSHTAPNVLVDHEFIPHRPNLPNGEPAPVYVVLFGNKTDAPQTLEAGSLFSRSLQYTPSPNIIKANPTVEYMGSTPPTIIKAWDGEYKLVKSFDQYHTYCNDDPEEGDGSTVDENFFVVFRVPITLVEFRPDHLSCIECGVCNGKLMEIRNNNVQAQLLSMAHKNYDTKIDVRSYDCYMCQNGHAYISTMTNNPDYGYYY